MLQINSAVLNNADDKYNLTHQTIVWQLVSIETFKYISK